MRLLRFLLIMACTTLAAVAQTHTNEVRKLSLEDCIRIALEHNLDVQIKKYNPELSKFTLAGAFGSYDPLFSASGGHDFSQQPGGLDAQSRPYAGTEQDINQFATSFSGLLPWGLTYKLGGQMSDAYGSRPELLVRTNFENVAGNVGFLQLDQPLLKNFWIDNTRLQIYLDRKNLQISVLDVRQQVIQTVTDVENAYYNLVYARDSVGVQQKALELAERLVVENKKRVEVGALAPLDEKQAEAQAAGNRADLLAAEGTEDTQERVLKLLLSDDYSKWKDVSIQPSAALVAVPETFNLQESWERGLRERVDLQQQQLNLEKQGFIIKYNKNQIFPQLDVVGAYGLNSSSSDLSGALSQYPGQDNPFWSVGGQLTIPLGNRTARNNYKFAKATREQIELQLKQLQQNVLIQIENSIANARTSFQRVDATRESRIYAQAALDAEQKKLENGKSTSFEVLRLQRDLTTAASNEIKALADYNVALANIAFAEGSTLDRRHINLDFK